jgi:diguanylate cyclase
MRESPRYASPIVASAHERARRAEAELVELHARLARLQAERDALWWAVGHDELTCLPNRRLFYQLAAPLVAVGDREAVVIVLDLNDFKPINDRLGHAVGDQVLRVVAQRLSGWANPNPSARLGGDEFAAILCGHDDDRHDHWWRRAITALDTAIAEPIRCGGHLVRVSAALGTAVADGQTSVGELLHRADLAMYETKQRAKLAPHYLELEVSQPESRVAPPDCAPEGRDPATVASADSYHSGDAVWVYRDGEWRAGIVEGASTLAVMATYRYAQGPGTAVDTVRAACVASACANSARET